MRMPGHRLWQCSHCKCVTTEASNEPPDGWWTCAPKRGHAELRCPPCVASFLGNAAQVEMFGDGL